MGVGEFQRRRHGDASRLFAQAITHYFLAKGPGRQPYSHFAAWVISSGRINSNCNGSLA